MKSIIAPAMALALLAVPFASATAATPPQSNAVQFHDLDLDTDAGQKTLDARIRNAARRVCDAGQRTGSRITSNACIEDVRRQVLAQVESYQDRVGKGG